MAKNDIFLIDGIIEDRVENQIPSNDIGEAFEYLAAEQITKDYDLSFEDIMSCMVDGRNDGGIDYIFYFVNGHLVLDSKDFIYPKTGSELVVYYITSKHNDSFKLQPVDSIHASLSELMDFNLKVENFDAEYNTNVIEKRNELFHIYRKIASSLAKFSINIVYACRGNTDELGENIMARGKQIETLMKKNFSECIAKFDFIGSSEILTKYRKVRKTDLELPVEKIFSKGCNYIILSKLFDYYRFITDETGALRMYLFDSNVRAFMGLNRTNNDILDTLENNVMSDFWLLNNGITILVTDAHNIGDVVSMKNIQIVNGLQTSETIYKYFASGQIDELNRSLLVKIIKSDDNTIRDNIIRATNNQTSVGLASLHATDKVQRDIEDILLKSGLYYERRVNYYKNQGISKDLISPLQLASGYVSLVMKLPHMAASLRSRFMNISEEYNIVFSEKTNLNVWPQIAFILLRTNNFLKDHIASIINSKRIYKLRYALSFITLSRIIGKYSFSVNDLISFKLEKFTDDELEITWEVIKLRINNDDIKLFSNRNYIFELCESFSNIEKPEIVKFIDNPFKMHHNFKLNDEFLDSVNKLLPKQPWSKGINKEIAEKLNCSPWKVTQAISKLIEQNKRNVQVDGVVRSC